MNFPDLFASSMRLIGAIDPGEVPTGSEVNDGRIIANQLLESWSADRLLVFTLTRAVFNLTAGKQTYTYGTGGDFNGARPPKIDYWSIISNQNPIQPMELKLDPLTDAEWQDVRVKNVTSALPRKLYDDESFPFRNISLWPIPSDSSPQVAAYAWAALQQFADLKTDYTFPPGYLRAIRYALAVELMPEYSGNPAVYPMLIATAREAKGIIRSMNAPMLKLKCDSALTGGEGGYNWITDNQ